MDGQRKLSKTVVTVLKEFMQKKLALQFVGALSRNASSPYVFVTTNLYNFLKGKIYLLLTKQTLTEEKFF